MHAEESIKRFGCYIQKLINREDLNRTESYTLFCQILNDEQPDLQQGAFLAALAAKGETPEEIVGAWQAIFERDTVRTEDDLGVPLVENSGTGMDAHDAVFHQHRAARHAVLERGVPGAPVGRSDPRRQSTRAVPPVGGDGCAGRRVGCRRYPGRPSR